MTYVDTGCLLIFRRVSQWKLLQHRKRPRLLREQERGLHLPREPEPGLQVLQKRQEVGCPCFEGEKSALLSIFLSAVLPVLMIIFVPFDLPSNAKVLDFSGFVQMSVDNIL